MKFSIVLRGVGYQTAALAPSLAVVLFLFSTVISLAPRLANAQSHPARIPQPGQVLRWVTIDGRTGRAEMMGGPSFSSGRIALRPGNRFCTNFDPCAPDILQLDALRQLEVRISAGTRRGAAVGGVIGLLFGLSLSSAFDSMDRSPGTDVLGYVALTGLSTGFFAILGAIVGARFETWCPVELPQ